MKRLIVFLIILTNFAVFSAAQAGNPGAFRQEGVASWYGTEFDGKPTASGEIFDSTLYTAAHPSLPFGTILTVTNRHNSLQVAVRINDRGPFVSARIVDLSKAAAEALEMLTTGTAPVLLERAVDTTLGPVQGSSVSVQIASEPVQSTSDPVPGSGGPVSVAELIVPETQPLQDIPETTSAPIVSAAPQPAPVRINTSIRLNNPQDTQ